MDTRPHCRILPSIGTGGCGTAERITGSWPSGSARSHANAGSPIRSGSCLCSQDDTSAEQSNSNSGRGERFTPHDRRNARMGVLGDARPVGSDNAVAGIKTLAPGAPSPHRHCWRLGGGNGSRAFRSDLANLVPRFVALGGQRRGDPRGAGESCRIHGADGHTPGATVLGLLPPFHWLAYFGAISDSYALIQINPRILLLHCRHRSDRGRKD
jgi:hypothetical protein